jgi:GNAT superfamily N-acetyltransferase
LRVAQYPTGDAALDREFELWTAAKTPDPDNENGLGHKGTLAWVYEQASVREGMDVQYPYRTFLFYFEATGELVATGSFVPDDRGVQKRFGLEGLGVWGYVNVDTTLYGRGLGTLVCQYLHHWIQRYADSIGDDQTAYLFTADPAAIAIYEKLKWVKQDQVVTVPEFSETPGLPPEEPLFRYVYVSGQADESALLPGAQIKPLYAGAVKHFAEGRSVAA